MEIGVPDTTLRKVRLQLDSKESQKKNATQNRHEPIFMVMHAKSIDKIGAMFSEMGSRGPR